MPHSLRFNIRKEHKPDDDDDDDDDNTFSSIFSTPKQPERSSLSRFVRLHKLFGRLSKFLQYGKDNSSSRDRSSMDEGNVFIADLSKQSFTISLLFSKTTGKFSNSEHPKKSRLPLNFNLKMPLETLFRLLQ